ncbi:MAG TPA: hypothetical protein VKE74_16955 [Gemmataceae bacterium]|nr:hypothetical protein [Gemmataceae bacterium]
MCRSCFALCLAVALAGLCGCGSSQPPGAPPTAKVKGTVNLNDKPIPVGEIHFGMPGVPPRVLEIKGGNFEGEAPVGKNQVEVFVYAEGPATEKYGGTRSKTNTVPQKYWGANTTLSATVNTGQVNEFKFDLSAR